MKAAPSSPKTQSGSADGTQEMLDGLPIPAAEICRTGTGPATILRSNDGFRALVRHDERLRGPLIADVPLLAERRTSRAIDTILSGGSVQQLEISDGYRRLLIRLAPLTGTDVAPHRCLLTLIEQSREAAVERGFNSEPLRDALTGLANRAAFEQRVAEVLEHPNFAAGSHALLSVRFDAPENQSVQGELLVAVGGRLLSALRAGDLLARTGEHGFTILMRLERGQSDASELADRLRAVVAASFRLSASELILSCNVEYAPLA